MKVTLNVRFVCSHFTNFLKYIFYFGGSLYFLLHFNSLGQFVLLFSLLTFQLTGTVRNFVSGGQEHAQEVFFLFFILGAVCIFYKITTHWDSSCYFSACLYFSLLGQSETLLQGAKSTPKRGFKSTPK